MPTVLRIGGLRVGNSFLSAGLVRRGSNRSRRKIHLPLDILILRRILEQFQPGVEAYVCQAGVAQIIRGF
jgi:hypothetical protein